MMKAYQLSKPYVLRALDASHRAALLFDDGDAVCDTMQAKSSIGAALHMALSGDELVAVLPVKTANIIMSHLKDYVKDKGGNGKTS